MLTIDELRAIPLFSGLGGEDLQRLASAAADVHLSAGEYAAHQGEDRALFAVISGKIEVTKKVQGFEQNVGWRLPGAIFGEVPITLGTVFPVGFRATVPSRVMRLEARHYYGLAAASPDVSLAVGALARERLGGLQGLAAKPPSPQATVIGHRWDPACHELRRFLTANQVVFDWLTPDSAEVAKRWPSWLPEENGPGLGLPDGALLLRPRLREVATRLGLQTSCRLPEYDTVDRRRRAGGPGSGCVRILRRAPHAGGGARGARRSGRNLLADRELPRLSQRGLRRRAGAPGAGTGQAARCGDPGDPPDLHVSTLPRVRCSSMTERCSGPEPSSSPPA